MYYYTQADLYVYKTVVTFSFVPYASSQLALITSHSKSIIN